MHVELIDPTEKLSPELGGTGYLPPREPATREALLADACRTDNGTAEIGRVVWKLSRRSVNTLPVKQLRIFNKRIPCEVVGSLREWLFISVPIESVKSALSKPTRATP